MKLSVVIPVFNEITTLEILLERVLAAPKTSEVILVDDCSTDGSRELVRQLSGQEQSVRPVGASQETTVNVRFLSATHKQLSDMVAKGEFREDLFYRINVIELAVPSLKDRGDDVLLLASHILQRLGKSADMLDAEARTAILNYAFPGNVRELENMLERAVTLCATGVIQAGDLAMRRDKSESDRPTSTGVADLGDQIVDVQRQAIVEALEKTRYNKTAAALSY